MVCVGGCLDIDNEFVVGSEFGTSRVGLEKAAKSMLCVFLSKYIWEERSTIDVVTESGAQISYLR